MRTQPAGGGRHTEGRRALQRAVGRDREREWHVGSCEGEGVYRRDSGGTK